MNQTVWITHDTFHRFQKSIGSTVEKAARPAGHCDYVCTNPFPYCYSWAGDPQ